MTSEEFGKLWILMGNLFPASPKTKSKNNRIAWANVLKPYLFEDAAEAVTAWARKNKFFPDPTEISSQLTEEEPRGSIRRRSNNAWMAKYIHQNAARITDEDAEEIHAAGLLTWGEAEKQGMSFRDWSRKYREKFPDGKTWPAYHRKPEELK